MSFCIRGSEKLWNIFLHFKHWSLPHMRTTCSRKIMRCSDQNHSFCVKTKSLFMLLSQIYTVSDMLFLFDFFCENLWDQKTHQLWERSEVSDIHGITLHGIHLWDMNVYRSRGSELLIYFLIIIFYSIIFILVFNTILFYTIFIEQFTLIAHWLYDFTY